MPQDGEKKPFVGDDDHWIECAYSAAARDWIGCRPVPKRAHMASTRSTKPLKLERLKKAELVRLIQTFGLKSSH